MILLLYDIIHQRYLMILIFSFSAKNGTSSAGMSIGYAKELARILSFLGFFQIHSNADLMMHAEAVHTFVRKTAHFTEYAVLGFFTYKAVSCDVLDRKKAVLTAQLISTGYASTDEIHQMFVPGREGKVFDVMIDSCGAFCGIMVSLITQKLIEKKKGNQIYDFLSFSCSLSWNPIPDPFFCCLVIFSFV